MKKSKLVLLGLIMAMAVTGCEKTQTEKPESGVEFESTGAEADDAQNAEGSGDAEGSEDAADAAQNADQTTADGKKLPFDISEASYSIVDDFDGDGNQEAFIFIGNELDEDWSTCYGDIWYVNENDRKIVREGGNWYVRDGEMFTEYETSNKKFVAVDDTYATALVTYLYSVDNGTISEPFVSGMGNFYKPEDTNCAEGYRITIDGYDVYCSYEKGKEQEAMYTGHSWKPYYFYYDEASGEFKAYGTSTITEDELNKAVGFDLAGEIRAEGYTVDSILKRDNGIINVNYSMITEDGTTVNAEYANATYDTVAGKFHSVWEEGVNTWQNSNYGGTYTE